MSQPLPSPALQPPPHTSSCFQRLSPSRTIVTSFTPRKTAVATTSTTSTNQLLEEGDWVLCIAAGTASIACAISNGDNNLYDPHTLHPQAVLKHPAQSPATDLLEQPGSGRWVTTHHNGTVILWDARASLSIAATATVPPAQRALCVAVGFQETVAAVGTSGGQIHFFDWRVVSSINNNNSNGQSTPPPQQRLLGSYTQSHTDEVTQLCFAPSTTATSTTAPLLLSGSDDGLLCFFDTTQSSEETALQLVLNTGSPVRKAGFCGHAQQQQQQHHGVYCLSGNETVSLWSTESAAPLYQSGWQTRQELSQTWWNATPPPPQAAAHASYRPTPVDVQPGLEYLVDAHWMPASNTLWILAGTPTGDTALFEMDPRSAVSSSSSGAAALRPRASWVGGHRAVVRGWCPVYHPSNPSNLVCMTAGEDARLCEWNMGATSNVDAAMEEESNNQMTTTPLLGGIKRPPSTPRNGGSNGSSGGPVRRQRPKLSTSPY